jgi:hypothetical protein
MSKRVMCGGQEIWSKTEYNRMVRNRVKHIGKIKDIAECRSSGSRDRSTGDRERRAMAQGGRVENVIRKSRDQS